MKERTLKTKLLTVLLTLCLALSFVPITAYAGVTDVTGDNTTNAYTHTYHTKVTTTAQVIIGCKRQCGRNNRNKQIRGFH